MVAWLIEYEGAVPAPVYVPQTFEDGCYTMNAWAAKRFQSKAEAERWMAKPIFNREDSGQPFFAPWHATEHAFETPCVVCGSDTGFFEYGKRGCCDGLHPILTRE